MSIMGQNSVQHNVVLENFSSTISLKEKSLKRCDKSTIKELTAFILKYKDKKDCINALITHLIGTISNVGQEMRLPLIYLMDAVARSGGSEIQQILALHLVTMFTRAFQHADSSVRSKMYKLRKTWTEQLFSNNLLNELDLSVRVIDPNWPILSKKSSTKMSSAELVSSKLNKGTNKILVSSSLLSSVNHLCPATPTADISPQSVVRGKTGTVLNIGVDDDVILRFGLGQRRPLSHKKENPVISDGVTSPFSSAQDVDMRQLKRKIISRDNSAKNARLANVCPVITEKNTEIIDTFLKRQDSLSVEQREQVLTYMAELVKLQDSNLKSKGSLSPPASASSLSLGNNESKEAPPAIFNIVVNDLKQQRKTDSSPPLSSCLSVDWSVEITGLPQLPPIGVDPRLLSLAKNPSNASLPQHVSVSGVLYSLHFQRLQPLVLCDGAVYRAVRYDINSPDRCVPLVIDGVRHRLPSNAPYKVKLTNGTSLVVVLGAVGHELIIDGCEYNVPFNVPLHNVSVGIFNLNLKLDCVEPQLRLCSPIPDQIMQWAAEGGFGSSLSIFDSQPRNPLSDKPERMASFVGWTFGKTKCAANNVSSQINNGATSSETASATASATTPASETVDVFSLVDQLIQAGLLPAAAAAAAGETQSPKLVLRDSFKLEAAFFEKHDNLCDNLHRGRLCDCGQRLVSNVKGNNAAHNNCDRRRLAAASYGWRDKPRRWTQSSYMWVHAMLENGSVR